MNLTHLARVAAATITAMSLAACARPEAADEVPESEPIAVAEGGVAGELKLAVLEKSVRGIFQHEKGIAELGIDVVGSDLYDIFVEANGLRLTMLVDRNGGVIEMDGYAAANGLNSQMSAEDRAIIRGMFVALDKMGVEGVANHVRLLRKMVDHWSEHTPTIALQRQKLFDLKKTVNALCTECKMYVKFSHDCSSGGWWADNTTAYGLVSHIGAYSGCAEGTKWSTTNGGTLYCLGSEPNHSTSYEYGKGNCFARCGGGCASEKDYTADCGNHDHCVRFGHADASMYCNDQLTSCSDDEAAWISCSSC